MLSKYLMLVSFFLYLGSYTSFAQAVNAPDDSVWIQLWDGDNLDDWDIKITGSSLNTNFNNTFRSVDGNLEVNYEDWSGFNGEFGHAGYKLRPFSFYFLRVEYQHWGNQVSGGPSWAYQNNGMMLHSQSIESMGQNQDFPVSMEAQLLGAGNTASDNNSTLNLCTPGTAFYTQPSGGSRNNDHCYSASNNERPGSGEWAWASFLVLGDSIIRHYNGPSVTENPDITYYRPVQASNSGAGGVTINITDNEPITEGYIVIQAESHPFRFRTIEVVDLVGCKDETAANYKSYVVKHDESLCEAGVPGCMDSTYQEYNPEATYEPDGACQNTATQSQLMARTIEWDARNNKLYVPDLMNYKVAVQNVNGKIVEEYSMNGSAELELGKGLEAGVYFIQILGADFNKTEKMVLNKGF